MEGMLFLMGGVGMHDTSLLWKQKFMESFESSNAQTSPRSPCRYDMSVKLPSPLPFTFHEWNVWISSKGFHLLII